MSMSAPSCQLLSKLVSFEGSLLPVVALVIVAVCLCTVLKRRKRTITAKPSTRTKSQSQSSAHTSLKKDGELKDKILKLANDTNKLNEEFKEIDKFVTNNISKKSTHESIKETNAAHNRYADVGNSLRKSVKLLQLCILFSSL